MTEDIHETEQHTEISHETTIYAEPVLEFENFTITNSLINTWLVVIAFIIFAIVVRKQLAKVPHGIQNALEMVIEGAMDLCDQITSDRHKSKLFFPLVFSLFLYLLINNWSGLLPGIGSIGYVAEHDGHATFVPFFRGGTADINTTLALALGSIILTHVFGFVMVGAWSYFNKFVQINVLLEIPKKIWKDPSIIMINPIKFFVGLIEIVGEIAKVASLAFRLFGNVFAGEVLLASIAVIFAFLTPIPFMFLEIIVGLIQALIFSVLVLVYLTISTAAEH